MGSDFKSSLMFAKTALANPQVVRTYHALKRNESLSVDELAEMNWKKRQRLLKFAYEQVPYYRKKYDKVGLVPEDIQSREQWETVPTLDKAELVDHFEELKAKGTNPSRLKLSITGGSTGEPVVVCHDKRFALEPLQWRMMSWWGVGPGEDAAFAWRALVPSKLARLRRQVLLWPTRRLYLDASFVNKASMEVFIRQCRSVRPSLLQGYVGALDSFADYLLENAIEFPVPKAVWVTASPISMTQRAKMRAAFQAPVYDQYGCGEIYQLAAQCAQSEHLHIFSDERCIEFLDDDGRSVGAGEQGQIALTDLENYVFPLIRYINGDGGAAIAGRCTCGVNLPLMSAVKGRTTDHLRMPDGGLIIGDVVTTIFDDDPNCVKAFQVYQKKDFSVDVRVVVNPAEPDANERISRVVEKLSAKAQGLVEVRLVNVAQIDSDRGKTRFVISER
jgi:phenylacetate-CoA ligase